MPTNVTVEYARAEKKFHEARTPEEQLSALCEMQRTAPSHKGAEKLRAEISRKIRRTREKIEKKAEQRKKASSHSLSVRKEGIGQIALVGMPNSGKSTLLKALTNADVEIAPYPFTTKEPKVAMMDYMNAKIQLVEVPPLIMGSAEGRAMGRELFSLIRTADAIALVLDAAKIESEFQVLKSEFEKARLSFNSRTTPVFIEKSKFRGISIVNEEKFSGELKELKRFLRKQGFSNSMIVLRARASLQDIKNAMESKVLSKKTIAVILEKNGVKATPQGLKTVSSEMPLVTVSALDEKAVSELKEKLFSLLDCILVFTKKPGQKPAEKPMALPLGATVEDAAKTLHKDLGKNLRFARIWGSSRYPGQRVSKDYRLRTGDILEVYG